MIEGMQVLVLALGAACAALAVAVLALRSRLRAARAEAAEAAKRAAPKPRQVEGRAERHGLLWFPILTVDDGQRRVLSASAGLPYCPRCLKPLALAKGPPEEWVCAGCADRRAGTAADMQVVDAMIAQAIHEFTARHADYRAAPGLPALKKTL
ncbi:MAG: hypothetical protein HY403_00735 [Elusimicrobia bacterium]|nr:hypothetical protein [Elusimicrobiota bacterium]